MHVIDLHVQFSTTSDWARFAWHDLDVHVVRRTLRVQGGGYVRSDGGYLAKASYDTAQVELTADIRAVVTGPAPRLELSKGNVGTTTFKLTSGRRTLAAVTHVGAVQDDDKNLRIVPLDTGLVLGLPGARTTHFPRLALAFYYGWYGTPDGPTGAWRHWNPLHAHRDSLNVPTGGWYDSLDPAVVDRHCRQARAAGLDGLILSWWNDEARNAQLLALLLPAARKHGLFVSIYIESAADPKALRERLTLLLGGAAKDPAWLQADAKPVFFLYRRVLDKLSRNQLLSATTGLAAFFVGDSLRPAHLGDFGALHTYYMARKTERYRMELRAVQRAARLADKRVIGTVMPGYDDTRVRRPGFVRPRRQDAFYRACFAAAAGADWLVLTSFNEWHEGSEIEPSVEHGRRFIDLTAELVAEWKAGP